MTCIVGVEYQGDVYMVADSSSVAGWQGVATTMPKVFRLGDILIGYTTSFRMGQILEYHLSPPADNHPGSPVGYLVKQLIPAIRELFREHGYMGKAEERECGGQFLVGYRGKLFLVDSDFQVNRSRDGYYAIGAGAEYALGSLFTTVDEPRISIRLDKAVGAAGKFSIGVIGPFFQEVLNGAE